MTRVKLLEDLKILIEKAVSDLKYPTAIQKGDTEYNEKVTEVFKMRLPESSSAKKLAPYILIQFLNGIDFQKNSKNADSTVVVRFIITTYAKDEQEGALLLLNLMDRVRIALLKNPVIGNCFKLDSDTGLESLVYIEDTAPYYAGEMVGTFIMPPIERECFLG